VGAYTLMEGRGGYVGLLCSKTSFGKEFFNQLVQFNMFDFVSCFIPGR
jgi:hypothetical protein